MTTDELNRLFAERVAGWSRKPQFDYHTGYEVRLVEICGRDTGELIPTEELPDYCASADAVLPWLEKERREKGNLVEASATAFVGRIAWVVRIVDNSTNTQFGDEAPTFAEAAVRALLRAKGALMR